MRSCRYNNERKKKSTTKNTNETFISWSINVWMHLRTEHTFSILYPHRLRVNDKHRQTPVFSPKLINNHTVARISQLPCDSHSFHRSSRSFSLPLRLSHTVSVRKYRVQVKYNQNIGFVLFCFVCPSSHVWMCVVSWCCFTRLKSERHRIDNIKIFSGVGKLNGTALGECCVCRDVLCIIKEAARGRKMCTQNQTYETNKTDRNEMATTTTTPELWHGIRIHPNPIETPYKPKNTIIFRPFSVSHTHKRTHNRAHRNLTVAYVITETTKINILHAKYHSDIPTFVIFLLYMGFVTDAMRYTMLLPMMMMILLKCSWKLCALHDEHHSFQSFCVSRTMNNNSHNFKTIRVYFYWTISMVVRACRQNSPLKSILMSHHLPLIYSFF